MISTALYRFFDADGSLLYIGITNNPVRRFMQHAGDKSWFPLVENVDVEWFDDRPLAEEAENESIWQEHPRFNIAHRWPFRPLVGDRESRVLSARDAIYQFATRARNPWVALMDEHQPEGATS